MTLQVMTCPYVSGPPLQRTAKPSKNSRGEGERQGQGRRRPTDGCTKNAAKTPAAQKGSAIAWTLDGPPALVTAHTSTHHGATQEHPRGARVTSTGQMETPKAESPALVMALACQTHSPRELGCQRRLHFLNWRLEQRLYVFQVEGL